MDKKQIFILVGLLCVLFVLVLINSGGFIMLGGEGNYFLDFSTVKDLHHHSWVDFNSGTGAPGVLFNFAALNFDFFSLLQIIGLTRFWLGIIWVFLIYAMPFVAMFVLLFKTLKIEFNWSIILSLFYILTPFSVAHFDAQILWSTLPFFVLPAVFSIMHYFYEQKLKLFILFGLFTFIFSFTFANIPYLAVFHIFLILSLILIPLTKNKRILIGNSLLIFLLLELSFFVFNFWWFVPMIFSSFATGTNLYNDDFAVSWANSAIANDALIRILSLRSLTSFTHKPTSFIEVFYNFPLIKILLFAPVIYIVSYFARLKKATSKLIYPLFAFFLFFIFLNKGANAPFGEIYVFLIKYLPFFNVFKSPWEKFSILLIFIIVVFLAISLPREKKKWFLYGSIIYISIMAMPFFLIQFNPAYQIEADKYVSKQFIDKIAYSQWRKIVNDDQQDYRIFSLPGSLNYQVTMFSHDNLYYRGMDPLVFAVNKSFITVYGSNKFENIYKNLNNENIENIFDILGVGRILLNTDIYPSFLFKETQSFEELDEIFSAKFEKWNDGPISMYSLPTRPIVYTANSIQQTAYNFQSLTSLVSDKNFDPKAIYLMSDTTTQQINFVLPEKEIKTPTIEFKKINPSEYKVIVHNALENFPLILNNTFDEKWRVYNTDIDKSENLDIDRIIINEGNSGAANREQIPIYIKNNEISELGTEDLADFISAKRNNAIQNDNLSDVKLRELLSANQISADKHFIANGFANSWWIDLSEIKQEQKFVDNGDNTIDFELTLFYEPEKLLIASKIVTVVAIITGVIILIFIRKKYESRTSN